MLRSRWAALVATVAVLSVGTATAQALTIQTGVVNVTASVPILGTLLNGVQTLLSGVVAATTTAACDATDNETVCSLTVLSYAVATDYVQPNGTHTANVTGAIINVPAFVDATGDGFPDLQVTATGLSASNVKLEIRRYLFAPANMPVSVEAIVADPSASNRVINVGYDARAKSAPNVWTANASITTGTSIKVNANLSVQGAPSTMAVVGGVYNPGPSGARLNPKQARLNYTPVPASSAIAFNLGPNAQTGTISAATQTRADLDLLLQDGAKGQRVNGTIDKLQKPITLLLDKVDGNQHVRLNTQKDVDNAKLTYESFTADGVMQRVRLNADKLPGQTDFTQTKEGILVDADSPIETVSGGVSLGVPPSETSSPKPVPANFPVESDDPSYVHQDTTNEVNSTTFRVKGIEHVSVATTGPQTNRKMTIGARLTSAPLHAVVTNDAQPGGTRYDADINDLPHNFTVAIAPAQKRLLEFCGSKTDQADPCSADAQAEPQGIANITLNEARSPEPLFGEAKKLTGVVNDIPSTLGLDLETRKPSGPSDPDQATRVRIDTTRPVGEVILRASDGSALPDNPTDDGVVFIDTPATWLVVARVHGLSSIRFDTSPLVPVDGSVKTAGNHVFDLDLTKQSDGDPMPLVVDGKINKLPSEVGVRVSNDNGVRMKYTASSTIGEISATVTGLPGSLPSIFARATDFPKELNVIAGDGTYAADTGANGGRIGLVEFQGGPNVADVGTWMPFRAEPGLTSGELRGDRDGFSYDDRGGVLRVGARVSGFRGFRYSPEGANAFFPMRVEADIDPALAQPFGLSLYKSGTPDSTYQGFIDRIQPKTKIAIGYGSRGNGFGFYDACCAPARLIHYEADGVLSKLDLRSNLGDANRYFRLQLQDLPRYMDVCFGTGDLSGHSCQRVAPQNHTPNEFDRRHKAAVDIEDYGTADRDMRVDMVLCLDNPVEAECDPIVPDADPHDIDDSISENYLRIDNMRIRNLALDIHGERCDNSLLFCGHLGVDTNSRTASVDDLVYYDKNVAEAGLTYGLLARVHWPADFVAEDFYSHWQGKPVLGFLSRANWHEGAVNCPNGWADNSDGYPPPPPDRPSMPMLIFDNFGTIDTPGLNLAGGYMCNAPLEGG